MAWAKGRSGNGHTLLMRNLAHNGEDLPDPRIPPTSTRSVSNPAVEVTVSHLGLNAAASIDRSTGASPTLSPVVNRAQRYIRSSIGEPLPLARIACVARCSRRHLCERFPLETGETVGTYIRRVRLLRAAGELQSGVKIMAVARGVGYRSYGNFVRVFRETFGAYPRTFRSDAARSEVH